MNIRLVVPADVDRPTGGNVYDLALAEALRVAGDEVTLVHCEVEALADTLHVPSPGHTLVDGLLACPQPDAVASSRAAVLVHMPLSLDSGLEPHRAAELDGLERRTLHAASRVIATSAWCSRYLRRHHGLADVAVAPPGVHPAAISAGSAPPLLVQVAALLPHKDQLGVVAALSQLADLEWRARLVGPVDRSPDYAAAVRKAVRAADLVDRIEIPGAMGRDKAWEGADLAVLPSRVEMFGLVVTEALARGVPVVVSEGGPAEALGVTSTGARPGVVVTAGNSDALARVLRRWLTDPRHRDELRAAALARRETLEGWDTTARRVSHALSGS